MKIRSRLLWTIITILTLFLASCSSAATVTAVNVQSLPLISTLAAGILTLEDTNLAISSTQAEGLLTLWQAYQVLSVSETTAQAELEALAEQIQDVLTDEQQQAIEAIGLTSASLAELTQSLSAEIDIVSTTSSEAEPSESAMFAVGPGGMGGGPGGMSSDDMSILMGDSGAGLDAQSGGSTPAQSGAQNSFLSPILLNALINALQAKVQAAN